MRPLPMSRNGNCVPAGANRLDATLPDCAEWGARGALYPKPSSCGADPPPEGDRGSESSGKATLKAGSQNGESFVNRVRSERKQP